MSRPSAAYSALVASGGAESPRVSSTKLPVFPFLKSLKEEYRTMLVGEETSSDYVFNRVVGSYSDVETAALREVRDEIVKSYEGRYQNPRDCANALVSYIMDPCGMYNYSSHIENISDPRMQNKSSLTKLVAILEKDSSVMRPESDPVAPGRAQHAVSTVYGMLASVASNEEDRSKYARAQSHYCVLAESCKYPPAQKAFADDLLCLGNNARKDGAIKEAVKYYGDVLSYPPAQYYYGLLLSKGYKDHRMLKMPEEYCEDAALQGYAEAQFSTGIIKQRSGNLLEARTWFEQAVDGGFNEAHYNLAACLFEMGNTTKGLLHIARAIGSSADERSIEFLSKRKMRFFGDFCNKVDTKSEANSPLSKDEIVEIIQKLKTIPAGHKRILKDQELVKDLILASKKAGREFSEIDLREIQAELISVEVRMDHASYSFLRKALGAKPRSASAGDAVDALVDATLTPLRPRSKSLSTVSSDSTNISPGAESITSPIVTTPAFQLPALQSPPTIVGLRVGEQEDDVCRQLQMSDSVTLGLLPQ